MPDGLSRDYTQLAQHWAAFAKDWTEPYREVMK
jgi:hypothetical protein